MRESNFAFPGQNRACVCISSQLYDRRALDTLCPLPLFNSLTHLTYLTSTSPRIREIMTMDGGLERLVRILHDFCLCPPPQENPALIYGLTPPNARPPKLVPTLNPQSFDKHAAYRFSLAFQCVVNIGVRGSEPIRSRVVQAGTLDVVGCILEAWLANKGFAVGPSTSATGMPRETREQRLARRQAHRNREEAMELARALERQIQVDNFIRLERAANGVDIYTLDDPMDLSLTLNTTDSSRLPSASSSRFQSRDSPSPDPYASTSTETSTAATPVGSNTPTGAVIVPGRDRSGTVIGRPVWDDPTPIVTRHRMHRTHHHHRPSPPGSASPPPSTDTSRPETETEDDGDGDVDMDHSDRRDIDEASPSPESRLDHLLIQRPRRAVGIVSDAPAAIPLQVNTDAHIMINDADGGVGGEGGMRVEDGIVLLEPNDDFAMGAPPGAPGAITIEDGATPRNMEIRVVGDGERPRNRNAPDVTPRAGVMSLPPTISDPVTMHGRVVMARDNGAVQRTGTIRGRTGSPTTIDIPNIPPTANRSPGLGLTINRTSSTHHRSIDVADSAPYRDEDVLLSLQLLAYLSKYPHVRQAFYKPRVTFHPASLNLGSRAGVSGGKGVLKNGTGPSVVGPSAPRNVPGSMMLPKESHGFFRAFTSAAGRGKEKEKEKLSAPSTSSTNAPSSSSPSLTQITPTTTRQTNVFSLVERFTFRPSSTETDLPNPPPKLPTEIQYWAGVIMRNACRKDEGRGGIRQCANMLCGRWESFPREFAKCRRCRKAKYCGKECQSTAWSEGHRFWCSAKDGDEEAPEQVSGDQMSANGDASGVGTAVDDTDPVGITMTGGTDGTITSRTERRAERERERYVRERTLATLASGVDSTQAARAANAFRASLNNTRGTVGINPNATFAVSPLANSPLPGPSGSSSATPAVFAQRTSVANLRNPHGRGPLGANTPGHHYHDPHPPMHSPSRGGPRPETVSGATTFTVADVSVDVLQTRLRLAAERRLPQQHLDSDQTNLRTPSGRHRGDSGFGIPGNEHDMILE